MGLSLLDRPELLQTLFFPEPATMRYSGEKAIWDGKFAVEGAELGYRLYVHQPTAPLMIYFHGNGELAVHYDGIASFFHQIGASLLVIDFRGYGWSTGTPTVTTLIEDVPAIVAALPSIQAQGGLQNPPLYVMGRSMGSAPAIEMASTFSHTFAGLIVESGFASIMPLLLRRGFDVSILGGEPDPIGNIHKIAELDLPLLVIHGENDLLIPVEQGQQLYDASPSPHKHILRMAGLGHNNLLLRPDAYFNAIATLIKLGNERIN